MRIYIYISCVHNRHNKPMSPNNNMHRMHTHIQGHTRHTTLPSSHARQACSAPGYSASSRCCSSAVCKHACSRKALHWQAAADRHAAASLCVAAAASPTTSSGLPTDRQRAAQELPAVGDVLELECSRLGTGGVGICLWGSSSWVVLVHRALPGELLRCKVTSVNRGYGEAVKVATLRQHADAVAAPCQHYGPCGGCTLQDLTYDRQLQLKAKQVGQLFVRVGKLPAEAVAAAMQAPVPAPAMFGHRNKLQFTFSSRTFVPGANPSEGEVVTAAALGFLRPGHADQVLPIRKCLLQGPAANAVLAVVQRVCMEQRLLPADDPSGTGVMKHLIIRSSSNSAGGSSVTDLEAGRGSVAEQLMVVLVTTDACGSKQLQPVVAAIHKVPEVVSVVHSIQHAAPGTIARSSSSRAGRSPSVNSGSRRDGRRKAQQASQPSSDVDEEDGMPDSSSRRPGQSSRNRRALAIASSTVLWGRPVLTQRLCGLDFDISAHSFFQTNVAAAELLYGCVAAACEPRSTDVLLDLYCGTGTIGLSLAASVQEVVGFDVSASSIADAQANAARNGIRNARFVCGDLDQLAARGLSEAPASAGAAAGEGSRIRRSPGQKQQRGKQVGRHDRGPPVGAGPSQLPAATAAVPAVQPNVVVVDPARAGLGMPVVRYLLSCTSAHRVVYVSCNAATQARDLQRLCEPTGGFRLVAWRAVDMFPHTDHIETVAVLDRAAVTDRC